MTREEAKQKLWSSGNINTLSKVECDDILNKVFDSLEQRNAELEQIVKELEEPKTCLNCSKHGECNIRKILINPSLNAFNVCITEEVTLFGCNYYEPKAQP